MSTSLNPASNGDLRFAPVTVNDVDAVRRLFASNPGYFRRVSGQEPADDDAQEALTARPPDVPIERKYGFGLWDADDLVAFADVIRDWPTPGTVHIGLLMSHGTRAGQGLGRRLHEDLRGAAGSWAGVTRFRIGIVDTNVEIAGPFWSALGYLPTGESRPYRSGTVASTVRIWALDHP